MEYEKRVFDNFLRSLEKEPLPLQIKVIRKYACFCCRWVKCCGAMPSNGAHGDLPCSAVFWDKKG